MPSEHTIFPDQRLIYGRLWGRITAEKLKAFSQELWADEAYDKSYDGIVDMLDAEFDMDRTDILAMSEFFLTSPDASEGRFVLLVRQPMETAISFLFQSSLARKIDLSVFSTWESVQNFLHLPDATIRQLARKS